MEVAVTMFYHIRRKKKSLETDLHCSIPVMLEHSASV